MKKSLFSGDDAEKYKGCYLKINRKDAKKLDKNTYFIVDLIGLEVYDENEARFDKLYKDAEITLTGTVESIKSNFMYSGSSTRYDSITLEDGWQVDIAHGSHDDVLLELSAGSTITVTSEIYSALGANIKLHSMSSPNGRIWDDYSEITLN